MHHSLPTSESWYYWKFVSEPMNPLTIPGYKVRTFKAYTNSNSPTSVKIAFFVNTYYHNGKGQVMQEIIYPNSITGKWEPIPPNLVKMCVEANPDDFLSMCPIKFSIEEVEGRALLTMDTHDWMKKLTIYSVLPVLSSMPRTPAGLIAMHCGLAMVAMAQYPDKLRTFADAEQAWNAFAKLNYMEHDGSEEYLKSKITWLRSQMDAESKEIEKYTKKEQEISESAAEAMNELSERFGIEIAL